MTVHRAAQSILTDEGHFAVRLVYRPQYAHDALPAEAHMLLDLGTECGVYYDGTVERVRLVTDGEILESNVLEFAIDDELTVEVEHSERRRRVRIRGAAVGDGPVDGDALPPSEINSQIYILGTQAGTDWVGVLVALRPLYAKTFAELADERLPSQLTPDGNLRRFVAALADGWGEVYDAALSLVDAFDWEHATGIQLDMIGERIALPRFGFPDDRYRTFIGIQIELLLAAAREDAEWTGTAPNLIRIVRQFVGPDAPTVRYVSCPPYCYTITVEDMVYSEAFLLARFLKSASWAGVLGLIQIELGEGNNLWASGSVSVPRGGIWASGSVSVPEAMVWSTAVEVK